MPHRARFPRDAFNRLIQLQIQQKSTNAGFTLVELITAAAISLITVAAAGTFMIQVLQSDLTDAANTQTKQEMQAAMNFIESELTSAVYVYSGACLESGQAAPGDTDYCPGLVTNNHIPTSADIGVPILAFWLLEAVDENDLNALRTAAGDNCVNFAGQFVAGRNLQFECQNLLFQRRTFTLVVYYLDRNRSLTSPFNVLAAERPWSGWSRIRRYELRKYQDFQTLALFGGYVDPAENNVSFQTWPEACVDTNCVNVQAVQPPLVGPGVTGAVTLTDFVDNPQATFPTPGCPDDVQLANGTSIRYARTPLETNPAARNSNSFYACVLNPWLTDDITNRPVGAANNNQSTYVFLRGNAFGKPGIVSPDQQNTIQPIVEVEILNRGVLGKDPRL